MIKAFAKNLTVILSISSIFCVFASAENSVFPIHLYQELSGKNQNANFVYSPFSISDAFELASYGARGETLKQLQSTFGFSGQKTEATNHDAEDILSVANRIWIQKGFTLEDAYLNACKTQKGATPGLVDFEKDSSGAIHEINQWVEKQTHDKIKDLIPGGALGSATRLVLTNAIYFKGKWLTPFLASATHDDDFKVSPAQKVKTPFMNKTFNANYFDDKQAQILDLPYLSKGKEAYAMTIVLPKDGIELSALEKTLSPAQIAQWTSNLTSKRVNISLPKFQMTANSQLKEVLEKIGLKIAFSSTDADFSGIDGKKGLFISAIFHKAFIKVDEEGTEAAAATAIGMRSNAVFREAPPIPFTANRPFLFYLSETHSNQILFMGKVMNPKL